jgi:hypothetical protein
VAATGTALPAGAWAQVTFDHAAAVALGASRADGADVRIARWDGAAWTETALFLDERSRWNAGDTTLWFRVAAPIAAGAQDQGHHIHFGEAASTSGATVRPSAILKGVQTGALSSVAHGALKVPIAKVDPARSFVLLQTRHDGERPTDAQVEIRLVGDSVLEVIRVTEESRPPPVHVRYWVLEFHAGVRVQRGVALQSAPAVRVPLQPVAPERSFVLFSKTPSPGNHDWDGNDPTVAHLLDATTLELSIYGVQFGSHSVTWEVVELTNPEDARVQRGTTRLGAAQLSAVATLPGLVDLARSFLLASFQVPGGVPSSEVGGKLISASLSAPAQVSFQRAVRSDFALPVIGWQVVELGREVIVHAGELSFVTGVAVASRALASPLDPARAVPFASVQAGGGQNAGRTPYTGNDVPGVCAATFSLTSAEVRAERASTVDRCDLSWFVVQFPPVGSAQPRGMFETVAACR